MAVPGRIAWLSSRGRNSGVGIQFLDTEEGNQAQTRIASELAGQLESDRPTLTL